MIEKVKSLFVVHAAFAGMFAYVTADDQGASMLPDAIVGAVVGVVGFPFVLSAIVRLNIAIGYCSPPFAVPKWSDNPFNTRDPMPFIQFA